MEKPFQGQVALITGGSRGIGRAISLTLARQGADIVINFLRRRSAAEQTAEEVRACGARAHLLKADVGEAEDVACMFQEIKEAFGGLDILVSNAALGVLRPAMELEVKHWERTMNICGRALLLLAQGAAPLMEKRGGGKIIAITSIGATRVLPHYAAVGAAKGVLETLTRYLACELAPKGIVVNAVSGGVVDTEALKFFPNRQELLAWGQRTPMGRVGRPEDIANVVALLCRPEANWICGQTIVADGGFSLLA